MEAERLPASKRSPLRMQAYAAIQDKGVRYLWGQFAMRASPYTPPNMYILHENDVSSPLVFLWLVYIKHTISINIDTKKFSIFPSLVSIFGIVGRILAGNAKKKSQTNSVCKSKLQIFFDINVFKYS